jgi:hypothetical protein
MRGEVQFRSDKLAVLIDADNTSVNVIEVLLKEITKFGTAYIKRVYGDWTSPQMNSWKKVLNDFAVVLCNNSVIQQEKIQRIVL